MKRERGNGRGPGRLAAVLALAFASDCAPYSVIGPLSHEQEERDHFLRRARAAGVSVELIDAVVPPMTPEEKHLAREQDAFCRTSYKWKNTFTWTGGTLVAIAAGITIGGAYATGNDNLDYKVAFGVSAGTLATLGSVLVVVGALVQQTFVDRGCTSSWSDR